MSAERRLHFNVNILHSGFSPAAWRNYSDRTLRDYLGLSCPANPYAIAAE